MTPTSGRLVWRILIGTVRFLGRLLQGLAALAVLGALVVALPWALSHYIGWPLPDHVPSWAEVQAVLLGPMTTTFLLDFLACLCWITWAAFTVDVIRCGVDAARGTRWPEVSATGPVHAIAAVLVGAIVLSILGNRTTTPASGSASTGLGTGSPVVATAPAWTPTPGSQAVTVRHAAFVTPTGELGASSAASPPESVVVRAPDPHTGVHDSLWRIADRTLGDGARWPEIFALNEGKPQPGGRTLTQPSLIYPGEELALPTSATTMPPPDTPRRPAPPPPTAITPPPSTSVPPTNPPSSTPRTPPARTDANPAPASREPGFGWGPDVFVGLGLAAAVSAALLVARRRYRRGYQPGSGRRDDLPVAPVVYQLRLAHLRTQQDDLDGELDGDHDDVQRHEHGTARPPFVVGAADPAGSGAGDSRSVTPALGVRDGREIALNVAVARGLGLVGAGTSAAARALVLAALTTPNAPTPGSTDHPAATPQTAGTSVMVPADDLVGLLGRRDGHAARPARLRVVASLDDALDELEAETLIRARDHEHNAAAGRHWPAVVLVARPPEHQRQRLQAVLDNGSAFGIVGVLLGQWQPGVTVYVRDDGTISATSPGLGEALRGTRMFRLGDDDTTELLDLLHHAQPEIPATTALAPPRPRPRGVATDPSGDETVPSDADGRGAGEGTAHHGTREADTELELTAETGTVEQADTELEIVAPRPVPPPGARLRPTNTIPERPDPPSAVDQDSTEEKPAQSNDHEPTDVNRGDTTPAGGTDTAPAPIQIAVLGQPRVYWRAEPGTQAHEITGALQPRTRELLVFLAVHPDGATREALVAALWADSPPEKTTNALNTALSRLRRALQKATGGALADIAVVGDGRYQLDPELVEVDYWQFDRAVTARRSAATEQARIDAYREVVNSYNGPLADGMSTEWIESAREAIRRDAIDAVAALARALVEDDPQQTLDLLEVARAFDPHNELLYRDIMRLQERLGRLDAIPRTLTLLTTRLAEVDDHPTKQAIGLATRLRQRHDDPPATQARSTAGADQGADRRGHSAAS